MENTEKHTLMSKKFNIPVEKKVTEQEQQHEKNIQYLKDKCQNRKLAVLVPMYGGLCHGPFSSSLSQLFVIAQKLGIEVQHFPIMQESLINRARNYLLQQFLDSNCTHFIFIDADVVFNPWDVLNLLAIQGEPDPLEKIGMDIVGALYPKKNLATDKMVAAVKAGLCDNSAEDILKYGVDLVVNPINCDQKIDLNKPVRVSDIGTGFMLMDRESVNKIRRNSSHLKYYPDHVRNKGFDGSRPIYNLFEVCIDEETNRLLSEDYGFLRLARRTGLNVFAMPWMRLQHIGNFVYQGSLFDLAELDKKIGENYHVSMSGPLIKK